MGASGWRPIHVMRSEKVCYFLSTCLVVYTAKPPPPRFNVSSNTSSPNRTGAALLIQGKQNAVDLRLSEPLRCPAVELQAQRLRADRLQHRVGRKHWQALPAPFQNLLAGQGG